MKNKFVMGEKFKIVSEFKPAGDQPKAIKELVNGIKRGTNPQTLLGVTGSGKSLEYNEPIFVKSKFGEIEKINIGAFVEKNLKFNGDSQETIYENLSGYKVLSFDKKFKIEEKEINQISKHKESILFEIVLDNNSRIKVTKDHNCFRLNNMNFELCKTSELNIGDYLPESQSMLLPEIKYKYINLLDYNINSKVAIDKLVTKFKVSKTLLLKLLKKHCPAPKWKLKQILNKTKDRSVTSDFLFNLLDNLDLDLKQSSPYIKLVNNEGDDLLSLLINISDDFLVFIGLYIAEGHNTGKYILISNENKKLRSRCIKFWKDLGLNYNIRDKCNIQFNSVILSNFFKQFGCNASSKKFSNLIYNLSNKQLSVVLQSLFDGDGWVENQRVCLVSDSKELVYDIKNILLRFNITSRINIKKNKKYNKSFLQINISGQENLKRFKDEINFSIDYKSKKLSKLLNKRANTNVDLFPNTANFLIKIRKNFSLSQKSLAKIIACNRSYISMIEKEKRQISKAKFKKLANWLIKKDVKYFYLKNLLQFNYCKIKSIKEVKNQFNYVYDLSIKGNENFVAGRGGIFVHNSFTIANVIEEVQMPTLVVVHNKTLAAQLYNEFKSFFPSNRVEYFVSFYDYYQPESYIPSTDQYIEKDSQINEYIERMRLSATASVASRKDVIIVASVSCIYGLGNPENFSGLGIDFEVGQKISRKDFLVKLLDAQYERNDLELISGRFRVKGDTVDVIPGYERDIIRIEFFGDEIENISIIDKQTLIKKQLLKHYFLFPARHFVTPEEETKKAIVSIKKELSEQLPKLGMIEKHRLKQRTNYDLELLEQFGFCKGIENYSRHFENRKEGEKPFCLLDYFKNKFLIVIDESHQTIPQFNGMYNGDRQRKQTLVDYGFRLPSALDNRPLKFNEFENYLKKQNVIYVSATPSKYEASTSKKIVEQIIRPTGLVDPVIEVRKTKVQMQNILEEISKVTKRGERVLVTTLTKKLAEEMSDYFASKKIKSRYLHSEIKTLERTELIRQLREGKFDVLVGINLLREGIDIPEVSLVAIFDADKEGFLRDKQSLIQIIGRAARNSASKVILYADKETKSIKEAIKETNRRRKIQLDYNKKNNIVPVTIKKNIEEQKIILKDTKHIPLAEKERLVPELEIEMKKAAEELNFELAIELRDQLNKLKQEISKKK